MHVTYEKAVAVMAGEGTGVPSIFVWNLKFSRTSSAVKSRNLEVEKSTPESKSSCCAVSNDFLPVTRRDETRRLRSGFFGRFLQGRATKNHARAKLDSLASFSRQDVRFYFLIISFYIFAIPRKLESSDSENIDSRRVRDKIDKLFRIYIHWTHKIHLIRNIVSLYDRNRLRNSFFSPYARIDSIKISRTQREEINTRCDECVGFAKYTRTTCLFSG